MKNLFLLAAAAGSLAALAVPATAEAKGCIRGAAAGTVAGHYARHHAVLGAVGGCMAGRYYYRHHRAAAHT